jgi:Cdc6-like AAA superfamily ATPase
MEDGVIRLIRHQDNEDRRAVLDWLTPLDYTTQQSDFIARRQEGTGQWLLDSDEFQEWLTKNNSTLFCPGMPGAGKTIIASIVVDHLFTRFQNDDSISIAYLYCNFQRQQEQKPTDLLMSLLKQVVQKRRSIPENIKSLYQRYMRKPARPSFEEISQAMLSVVTDYSRVFIIIDALDECQFNNGSRKRLLSEMFTLQAKTGANLFATSRYIPEITKEFEGRGTSLKIRASDKDVQRYLDGRMPHLLRSSIWKYPDFQDMIKREIVKAADGMYAHPFINL